MNIIETWDDFTSSDKIMFQKKNTFAISRNEVLSRI